MEATYSISERDFVGASKLFSRIGWRYASTIVLIVTVSVVTGFFAPRRAAVPLIIGLVVWGAIILLNRLVLMPFLAARHYRNYKAIQVPITIRLQDDGIRFTTSDGDVVTRWDKIFKWRQDNRYLLVYLSPRLFHVIPKSVADSGFDLSSLVEVLQANVGEAT